MTFDLDLRHAGYRAQNVLNIWHSELRVIPNEGEARGGTCFLQQQQVPPLAARAFGMTVNGIPRWRSEILNKR